MKATPCVRFEKKTLLLKVDDAVENKPPRNPACVNVLVAVPPNCAELADSIVDDALPKNFCSPVHVLATEKSHEKAPDAPPIKEPSVPEYVSGEDTVGVEVAIVATFPFDPMYAEPCDSDGRNVLPLSVVDEFENRPE